MKLFLFGVVIFLYLIVSGCGKEVIAAEPIEEWDGLVAYYPLDGNANDESGNGHNGFPASQASFSTTDRHGNSNSALYVGSDNAYVTIPNHSQLEVLNYTISAWVKKTPGGSNGGIFNNGDVGQIDHYALRGYGEFVSHIIEYDDPGFEHKFNTDVLSDGDWHHLLVTYGGLVSSIWIDGVEVDEYYRNLPIAYYTS